MQACHSNPAQAKRVLAYLKDGGTLTSRDAQRLFQCDRLGARIHELRQAGHPVKTEIVNRNGKRFACYYLK